LPTIAHTSAQAQRLATLLTQPSRDDPSIVIATYDLPPEINPQELEDRTNAEVHVLLGYTAMQSFADMLPPKTSVFASRGTTRLRVYPTDLDWMRNQTLSQHLPAEDGRRFTGHTLPDILQLVDDARASSAEGYDRGAALGTTIASAISDDVHAKMLAAIANSPAAPKPKPMDHDVTPMAPQERPPLQRSEEDASELASLRTDLDAERHKLAALELTLREAEDAKRQAIAAKAGCRCQQIGEAGSAAAAIEAAENQAMAAAHKANDAERRANNHREKADKLRRSRPALKWIEPLDASEEDLLRLLIQHTWNQTYGADDQKTYPLGEFELQAPFVDTINRLQDADRKKILAVMTEVITGRSIHRFGAHPWRTAEGAEEANAEDPRLGTLMRVYLENNTPAAQRLHYWKKGAEPIRFHSVLRHDDKVTWPIQK
jgi:hypothetical protein